MQVRVQGVQWLALVGNALVVLGLWIATRVLQGSYPVQYTFLVLEDGWVEYGSFAAWVVSAVVFFWAAIRAPGGPRVVSFLLSVAALLMAMEEISWFQRVIGWSGPEALVSGNRQAETNLHNLVLLAEVYRPLACGIVVWSVVPWLLTRVWGGWRRFCDRWALPIVPPRLWPWFFLAALFLAEVFLPRPHEVGELFLAMAISALALDRLLSGRQEPGSPSLLPAVPLIVVPILIAATTLTVAVFPEPRPRVFDRSVYRLGRQRLVSGRYLQAMVVFDHLEANPKRYLEDVEFFHGFALLAGGREDEGRALLEQYLVSFGISPTEHVDEAVVLPNATKSHRVGLALCATDRRTEAAALFERTEAALRGRLPRSRNRRAEARSRGLLSETLVILGRPEEARIELSGALDLMAGRDRNDLRAQFREIVVIAELAGCSGSE